MLELFEKHMKFVGLEIIGEAKQHEKFIHSFDDAVTNKHWLSFWATYNKGYNQAINDVVCPLVNKLKEQK